MYIVCTIWISCISGHQHLLFKKIDIT